MSYKDIFNDIKKNTIQSLYLFHGEEEYIKLQALDKLEKMLITPELRDLNYQVFDGSEVRADDIINAGETLPFMSEKRLVVIKDYPLLISGNTRGVNEESEFGRLANYFKNLPASTCMVFMTHGNADKRKKLVGAIKKHGKIIDFDLLQEREIIKWVNNTVGKFGKSIHPSDIQYLVYFTGKKLEDIYNELLKLVDYIGDRKTISREDIDQTVTKSLEHSVFEMIDQLGNKKLEEGIRIFHHMLSDGENPLGILAMIARHFRIMLQVRLMMEKGYSAGTISEKLKLPSFVVTKATRQMKYFSENQLKRLLAACLEADEGVKAGRMRDQLAVEMVILKEITR